MADTPTTGWDVQRIHAEAAAIEAAIEAAHHDTPRCCCACDACAMAQRFMARMMPRFAQQCTDTEQKATAAERKATAAQRQAQDVINQQTAAHAALLADYEALQEGHTALLADFSNLHAAYVMALEALSRGRGQGPELH